MLDPDSPFKRQPPPAPLQQVAHDRLRSAIVGGELMPGMRVSEAGLCARYGLAKAAVRHALARLLAEGFLDAAPRSGYTIAPLTPRGLGDLIESRRLLEPALAGLGSAGTNLAEVQKQAIIADMAALSRDRRAAFGAERAFRAALAAGLENEMVRHWLARLWDDSQRAALVLELPTQTLAHLGCTDLVAVLRSGDQQAALAALSARIDAFATAIDQALRKLDTSLIPPKKETAARPEGKRQMRAPFTPGKHQQGDTKQ